METYKRLNYILPILLATLSSTALAEPVQLGYERWSSDWTISEVIFDQPPEWYYGTYADKLTIGQSGIPDVPDAPYRLIDIEITNEAFGYNMDGISVQNSGEFKSRSWMLHGLSKEDVTAIAKLDNAVILDLEAYDDYWGIDNKYALILKENPKMFKSEVFIDVPWESFEGLIKSGDWRPIDIDILSTPGYDIHDLNGWTTLRYNAVLVENTGDNYKYTRVVNTQSPYDVDDGTVSGMQLVDMEQRLSCSEYISCPTRVNEPCERACETVRTFLTIHVDNGSAFEFHSPMTNSYNDADIYGVDQFDEVAKKLGRCVDVEGDYWVPKNNPHGRSAVFLKE